MTEETKTPFEVALAAKQRMRTRRQIRGKLKQAERMPEQALYMRIKCPNGNCKQHVALKCSFCHKGHLEAKGKSQALICDCCHHSVKHVNCHCGFPLKTSFIFDRVKNYKRVSKNAESGGLALAFLACSSISSFFLLLSIF